MSSHREVFRIVTGGAAPDWVSVEFTTYEEALDCAQAAFDRFRIEKVYVRK